MSALLNSKDGYGVVSRWIHWSSALLIIALIVVGFKMSSMEASEVKYLLYGYHKQWGVVAGMLIFVRLIWLSNNPQVEAFKDAKWRMRCAKITKKMLYFFMIAYPISGVIMSMAGGHGINFFGFQLPQFVEENAEIAEMMHGLHNAMSWAFVMVISLHILAALYHLHKLKDGLLPRMLGAKDAG
tara:strand:+ start:18399 stop:18950 length:552 start_codon:yes stop_codon:yes gene_type:complete